MTARVEGRLVSQPQEPAAIASRGAERAGGVALSRFRRRRRQPAGYADAIPAFTLDRQSARLT